MRQIESEPDRPDLVKLLATIDDGIVIIDRLPTGTDERRDWRYVMINPAFCRIFGRGDMTGQTIRANFPGEDEGWYDIYDRVAAEGQSLRFIREAQSEGMALEMFVAPLGLNKHGQPRLVASMRNVTSLLGTQRALERSEERLRLATEAAEVGFWDVDEVNQILTWPPRVKAMFGISSDVPVSMADFYAGLHPEGRARVTAAYAAAADPETRALYDVEYRTVGKEDGTIRWVAAKGRGVFDAAGRCLRVIGTAIDITERKAEAIRLLESEAALNETTATLDAAIHYAPIGFALSDRARRFVRVNDALAKINGRPVEDHIGQTAEEIIPKIATIVRAQVDRVFDNGRPIDGLEIEGETASAPGGQRAWLASFFPVFGAAGEVQFVGVTVIDITDRKRAEARVRELNESLERRVEEALAEKSQLAEVLDRTDIFAQVVDCDFNWLAINQAAAAEFSRIYGVPKPKPGNNMLEALSRFPEHRAAVQTVWSRALGGEEFIDVQPFGDEARDRRYYEMRFRTLRDAEGRPIGAYQFVADVTDRQREQARLAEAEAALIQAQKLDAMGQLTGGVAHDFNNLLTPIVAGLDTLQRRGVGGEREQRLIAGALQSAERAKTLVQRLLAFARRQPLQPGPVDVASLVQGMADLLGSTIGPHIKLIVETAEGLPLARANSNQLEMAILNLSVNARDAMEQGGTLRIVADAPSMNSGHPTNLRQGHYVRIAVSDTGCGMDERVMARAVEPFFSTKGVGKGTGLGLSMVHGLASQLGGVLTISSREGEGSTIELWLPVSGNQPARRSSTIRIASLGSRAELFSLSTTKRR